MLITSALAACMAFALGGPAASAQEPLSLEQARRLVLANSAALRKAELAVETATLAEKAQAFKRLPSISAGAGGTYDYSAAPADGLGASARLSVSQAVYDGGKLASLSRSASVAVRAAAEAARAVRVSLVGQADEAFYTALKAASSVEAAERDLEAAALRLGLAKARAEAGLIAGSDYLQAESEAAARETALIKARRALASARARLASMTGQSAAVEPEPVEFSAYDGLLARLSALDDGAVGGVSGELLAIAIEENPSLAGYALAASKATIAVDAARSAYSPTVSAGLSQSLAYDAGSGLSVGAGSVSLTATMSLDLWVAANGVESAELAARSARIDADQGARDVALDLEVALNGLLSSARAVASSAKALEFAESTYGNALRKYELSSASASELSTAEALVSAARTALIGARYDALSAISELRGIVGLESEDRILAALP